MALNTGPDNRQVTKEAIYEARRLLVGRLQERTRGVSQSRRIQELQSFGRAWEELSSTRRLGDLVLFLEGQQPMDAIPGFLATLAVARQVQTQAPNLPSSRALAGVGETGEAPNSKRWWVGNRQEDLFPAGLAAQPV